MTRRPPTPAPGALHAPPPGTPSPRRALPLRPLVPALLLGLVLLGGCASPSSRPGWEGQATPQSRELAQALALPGRWQAVAVGTARVRGLREDILCVLSSGPGPGAPVKVLVYHIWGLRLAELTVSREQARTLESRPLLFRVPGLDARLAKALQRGLALRPDALSGAASTPQGLMLRRRSPNGAAVEWTVTPTGAIQAIQGLGTERFQAQWQGQGPLPGLPELLTYHDPQDGFSLSLSFPADQQAGGGPGHEAPGSGIPPQDALPAAGGPGQPHAPAGEPGQPEGPAAGSAPQPAAPTPDRQAPGTSSPVQASEAGGSAAQVPASEAGGSAAPSQDAEALRPQAHTPVQETPQPEARAQAGEGSGPHAQAPDQAWTRADETARPVDQMPGTDASLLEAPAPGDAPQPVSPAPRRRALRPGVQAPDAQAARPEDRKPVDAAAQPEASGPASGDEPASR